MECDDRQAQVAVSKATEGEEGSPCTHPSICPPGRQHPVVGTKVGSELGFWG